MFHYSTPRASFGLGMAWTCPTQFSKSYFCPPLTLIASSRLPCFFENPVDVKCSTEINIQRWKDVSFWWPNTKTNTKPNTTSNNNIYGYYDVIPSNGFRWGSSHHSTFLRLSPSYRLDTLDADIELSINMMRWCDDFSFRDLAWGDFSGFSVTLNNVIVDGEIPKLLIVSCS